MKKDFFKSILLTFSAVPMGVQPVRLNGAPNSQGPQISSSRGWLVKIWPMSFALALGELVPSLLFRGRNGASVFSPRTIWAGAQGVGG